MGSYRTILLEAAWGIALVASLPSFGQAALDVTNRVSDAISSPGPMPRNVEASGNPLWAIPLESLIATRERPLFRPSRRAPIATPVIASPAPEPAPSPSIKADPPQFALLGAVVGTAPTRDLAVLLDQTTQGVVRLRTGEGHSGWILRSVKRREATLEKDGESLLLALPVFAEHRSGPEESPAPSAPARSPTLPWAGQAPPATPIALAQLPSSDQAEPSTAEPPARLPWSGQAPPPILEPSPPLAWSGQAPPSVPEIPTPLPWSGQTPPLIAEPSPPLPWQGVTR
jgi:general secretion pathway protein N